MDSTAIPSFICSVLLASDRDAVLMSSLCRQFPLANASYHFQNRCLGHVVNSPVDFDVGGGLNGSI